jgi:hypothetical protein
MGIKLKAGSKFYSGMTISNGATLYYLVSSHLPSDYAVYLYDKSGNELVRIPKPNDASDSWGNKIATNDIKIAITDNYSLGALYIYDMDGSNMVKVTSSDASGNYKFGTTLKINTTKIIVGTPNAPLGSANYVGAVYVYDLDGTNEVKITPSDGAHGDNFSTQEGLGVSESKIFVGSNGHENQTGALYIYDLDGSNEVKVQPSDSAEGDDFGYIVAASATKVVSTSNGSGAHGAAYIFDHDGTNEVKMEPSVDGRNGSFGQAAAAINNTHVAISDRAFSSNKGAIYIYNIDGSNEVRIEHPSHFNNWDLLGFNLAMSVNKVFSCAPNDDDGGSSTGNVYEYNLDGTGERTLPTPSTFAAGSRFGSGLYIYDTNLIPYVAPPSAVPAFFVHSHVSGRVSVPKVYDGSGNHLFTIHEGAQLAAVSAGRIYASDHNQNRVFVYAQDGSVDFMINTPTTFDAGPHGGHFGQGIAAGYGKVAIGAPRSSENFSQQGAVYVYDADGTNEVKIQRSNPAANDMFGQKILITDAHIFVFNANAAQFICRYDHDGTNELELTGTITRTSYQFFDNKIVTTSNNGTHVMNPDFTGEVVVAAPSGSDGFGNWSGVDTFNNRLVIQAKNAYYVYDSSDLTSPSNTISAGFSGDIGKMVVAGDKIIGLNNIGTLVKFEIIGTDGTGSYTFNVNNAGPYVNLSGGSF